MVGCITANAAGLFGLYRFFSISERPFSGLTIVFGLAALLASGRKSERGPWDLTFPIAALVILSFISTLTSVDQSFSLYHSSRFF